MYPKLQLGERVPTGKNDKNGEPAYAIKPTGPQVVKITAEPTTTTIKKAGVETKVFKFIVEKNGQKYKWYVPIMNKDGSEGHYLIERLMDVEVGEEITLEMKKQGARNYIDVRRAGEPERHDEDEVEVDDSDEARAEDFASEAEQ